MVKLINHVTHGEMWVADDRVPEYIAAGHKPAADPAPEKPKEEKPKRRPKKAKE